MKIQCPNCNTVYSIDENKIPEKGARVRCRKCDSRIHVSKKEKEGLVAGKASGASAPPAPKPVEAAAPRKKSGVPEKARDSDLGLNYTRLDEYVKQGDQDAAARLLLDMVTKSAQERDFRTAEEMLEKMYEVTPMALNEVVKASEVIEQSKSQSMDPKHLKLWSELYKALETDEANELYFTLKPFSVKMGDSVFKQGESDSNLYFLESGRMKMVFFNKGTSSETVLKELTPGEISNANSFISFSLTNFTLTAVTDSELKYLSKDIISEWKNKYPGLVKKVGNFCRSKEQISSLIEKSGKELRAHKRIKVPMQALIQILDSSGKPARIPFKVLLYDISAGGASYIVKQSQEDEAGRMLGNVLIFQTVYLIDGEKQKVTKKAKVVAVRLRPFDESSVHLEFDKPLEDRIIKAIEYAAPRG